MGVDSTVARTGRWRHLRLDLGFLGCRFFSDAPVLSRLGLGLDTDFNFDVCSDLGQLVPVLVWLAGCDRRCFALLSYLYI